MKIICPPLAVALTAAFVGLHARADEGRSRQHEKPPVTVKKPRIVRLP